MVTGKCDPSRRSKGVSSLVTLCPSARARMAGSRRKSGAFPVGTTGPSSSVSRRYQPSMLAPAGFMKVTWPSSLTAQTPSPRLPVITDNFSRCCWTSA